MRILTTLFLLTGLLGQLTAQTLNGLASPTDTHQLIGGTNVYLVPPAGFAPSENFKGFQDPDIPEAMIMLMEIPGPFSEVTKGFEPEMMEARGMSLLKKDSVQVGNFAGYLVEMEQAANGITFFKSILIYGNEASTTLVNGVAPKDSSDLNAKIRASIQSIVVDEEIEADPRAELNFTVDEHAGNLQFISVIGNGILLNRDGKTPTESEDKATLIIDKSFQVAPVDDREDFCRSRLAQFPEAWKISKKGIEVTELAGLPGYELRAVNEDNTTEALYQLILFPESGGYYIFVGMYAAEEAEALTDIKKCIETFTVRP